MICRCAAFMLLLIASQTFADDKVDLWAAAKLGDLEKIKSLVESGVEVDAKTRYGATALAYASERGHLEVVKYLLKKGADVNNKDEFYKFTPRTWAQASGHTEVAKLLEENGGESRFSPRPKKKTDSEKNKSADEKSNEKDKPAGSVKADATDTEPEEQEFEFPEMSEADIVKDDAEVSSPNWPQFRGSGARGIADGQHPPTQWDLTEEDENNLKWRTEIPGLGHSSPVIWGNRLFVTTAISSAENDDLQIGAYGDVESVDDDSEHDFKIYCLDKTSGKILWDRVATKTVPFVRRHLKSTHADPSVATDGKSVVAFFGAEGLHCYDVDGKLKWKKDLGRLDSGWFYDAGYQWEFGSSPVIHDGHVIVQCDVQEDSFLAAYNLENGNEVWRTERDEIPGWATPTVHETPSGAMIFTNGTRQMRCYFADTGKLAWSFDDNSEITAPTPFVAYGSAYVTAGYSPIQPIRAITLAARGDLTLEPKQTQSQFVRWSLKKGGPYLPTPIAYRGNLYVCSNSGILTCYDAQSGERHYRKRLKMPGQSSFVGSSVAADGHLYFPAEDGHVAVVVAGDEYKLKTVNSVGEYILSSPSISEGSIFFRTQHHVVAFADESKN